MLYILSKDDLSIKDVIQSSSVEVNQDINLNGKSYFIANFNPNIASGDYVLYKNTTYKFVVSNIETIKENSSYKITANEVDCIFDRKIILSNQSLISTIGIEDFIVKAIKDNFSQSTDNLLNLSYINVSALTHTIINAAVETEDGIYNLKTYLGNVKEKYDICIDYEFGDTLDISVYKRDVSTLNVDTTIEDVVTYQEVYSVDAISKVTVLATDTGSQFNYFLLTDRTISTNVNSISRAKGTVDVVTCQKNEEAYQKALDTFKGNSYQHNIELTLTKESKIYNESDFIVGRKLRIKTKDNVIYDTFISSINKKSDSNIYTVKCGNIKVTLLEKLKGVVK